MYLCKGAYGEHPSDSVVWLVMGIYTSVGPYRRQSFADILLLHAWCVQRLAPFVDG
jgi:hypothetical protein